MPLSEHEQRLLEQIERALVDDDPKFASSVRTGDRRLKARRKLQLGAVVVVVGLAVMVGGVAAQSVIIGVLGSCSPSPAWRSGSSTTRRPPAPSRPAARPPVAAARQMPAGPAAARSAASR